MMPPLSKPAIQALRVIAQRGNARGAEIIYETRLSDPQLVDALETALKYDLVQVSGNPYDANEISRAVFTIPPSKIKLVEFAMAQAS